MNIENVTSNNIVLSDFIKPSLMKQPKIAIAVEEGKDKILDSLKCMAANNQSIVLSDDIKPIPEASLEALSELSKKDPEKSMLIIEAYYEMVRQVGKVSEKTVNALISEFINLKDTTTLKKALDSGVQILLLKTKQLATVGSYANTSKWIILNEDLFGRNDVNSLAHELGHAFDQNSPIGQNPHLHRRLIPKLEKNEDGTYKCTGLLPNAKQKLSKNPKLPEGKRDIISDYASTSVEFNEAFKKDCEHLLKIDKVYGFKKGTTFKNLLKDWNSKSLFAYYLGVPEKGDKKIDKYILQREMFAQMAALSVMGYTTRPVFDKIALKYFPNTFKFVDELINNEF